MGAGRTSSDVAMVAMEVVEAVEAELIGARRRLKKIHEQDWEQKRGQRWTVHCCQENVRRERFHRFEVRRDLCLDRSLQSGVDADADADSEVLMGVNSKSTFFLEEAS